MKPLELPGRPLLEGLCVSALLNARMVILQVLKTWLTLQGWETSSGIANTGDA